MNLAGFLDNDSKPEPPRRKPGRRDLGGLAALALLCAGAGLVFAALQSPGPQVPKPGPRRYGPAYQHRESR